MSSLWRVPKYDEYFRTEEAARAAGAEACDQLRIARDKMETRRNGYVSGAWVVTIKDRRIHLTTYGPEFNWDAIAGMHDVPTGQCPMFGEGCHPNPKAAVLKAVKAYADKLQAAQELWHLELAPVLDGLRYRG